MWPIPQRKAAVDPSWLLSFALNTGACSATGCCDKHWSCLCVGRQCCWPVGSGPPCHCTVPTDCAGLSWSARGSSRWGGGDTALWCSSRQRGLWRCTHSLPDAAWRCIRCWYSTHRVHVCHVWFHLHMCAVAVAVCCVLLLLLLLWLPWWRAGDHTFGQLGVGRMKQPHEQPASASTTPTHAAAGAAAVAFIQPACNVAEPLAVAKLCSVSGSEGSTPRIKAVAAGATHSAAISGASALSTSTPHRCVPTMMLTSPSLTSEDGRLFTWGAGVALGLGQATAPHLRGAANQHQPCLVQWFDVGRPNARQDQSPLTVPSHTSPAPSPSTMRVAPPPPNCEERAVTHVACGWLHTAVVSVQYSAAYTAPTQSIGGLTSAVALACVTCRAWEKCS